MARLTRLAFAAFALGAVTPAPARAAVTLATGGPATDLMATRVEVDGGLSQPTDVAELPDGRLVIIERMGDVKVVSADGGTTTEAGTITVNPDFGEQGLLGVVADPAFASNNTLYFYASVGSDVANKHKVYKLTLGADSTLDAARNMIISMGLRASRQNVDGGFGNHNGGGLVIHNNMLYVSVGDTGHNATPPTNHLGTCLNWPNGKILRVALNGDIPMDNPLVGETMVTGCTDWDQNLTMQAPDTRIFAWGMRNPFRFWIDPMTDRLWIGDVGETTNEEVSVGAPITAAGGDGQHFGWPFREGHTSYSQSWQPQGACMGVTPARECVPQVFDYPHEDNDPQRTNDNCVIGGLIIGGCGWEAPWTSKYIFGDNGSGRVWTLDVNQDRSGVVANSLADFASSNGPAAFRMGASGNLYIVEAGAGLVTKVTPKGQMPGTCMGMGGMGGGGMPGGGAGGTAGDATGGMSAGGTGDGGTGVSGGGTGGMTTGGTGGAAGTTGGVGTGGATGGAGGATGGTSGGTAGTGTGGTGTGGTGTGGTGTGGTGTGGANAAGAGTGATAGTGDKGGCGCRVASGGDNLGAVLASLGGLALLGARRARQRRAKLG